MWEAATFKTKRESLGISVNELAKATGVSPRSVQWWEAGKVEIPDDANDYLDRIEDIFDDCINGALDLLDGIDDFSPERHQALTPSDEQAFIDILMEMPSLEESLPILAIPRPRTKEIYRELYPSAQLSYTSYLAAINAFMRQAGTFFVEIRVMWVDENTPLLGEELFIATQCENKELWMLELMPEELLFQHLRT